MGRFTKLVINPVVGLLLLSSISACQTTNGNSISTSYKEAPYKRIIQFASNHEGLLNATEKMARTEPSFLLTHEDEFSEFRIVLATKVERINTLETKPLLLGRLQRTKTPVNFKVSYRLTNTSRHVIAKGEFSEITETTTSIYPKLNVSANIEEKTLNKLSKTIMKEVYTHIRSIPWSTTVIGQKDDRHVTVFTSEDAGLTPGDIFITESQPTATLQVAMFEKTAQGQSRAILNLKEGFLPSVGRRLIPASK
tara:strand:+ start:46918 stop:47673 length:756 start_codon:yes stop_codon:yes gene_type:complete